MNVYRTIPPPQLRARSRLPLIAKLIVHRLSSRLRIVRWLCGGHWETRGHGPTLEWLQFSRCTPSKEWAGDWIECDDCGHILIHHSRFIR